MSKLQTRYPREDADRTGVNVYLNPKPEVHPVGRARRIV
jgi:hypothetical protein